MDQHKKNSIAYLRKKAESDLLKAKVSLGLLLDVPVGIGDHSTGDFHSNLDEALDLLVDANDRIETLEKYYPDV
tara:strand:- start:4550 stop:4771 length:222 start_codon:yes stop_codon:yes gene_type:complete